MNLEIKKIIAKEFLYFFLTVCVCILTLVYCYSFNLIKEIELNQLAANKDILYNDKENIKNTLKLKKIAQLHLLTTYSKQFYPEYTVKELEESLNYWWKSMQKYKNLSTADYHWKNKWSNDKVVFSKQYGFNNAEEFSKFINDNSQTISDSIFQLNFKNSISSITNQQKDIINEQYSANQIKSFLVYTFVIVFTFLFILRYLIIAFNWSRKTLGQ